MDDTLPTLVSAWGTKNPDLLEAAAQCPEPEVPPRRPMKEQ